MPLPMPLPLVPLPRIPPPPRIPGAYAVGSTFSGGIRHYSAPARNDAPTTTAGQTNSDDEAISLNSVIAHTVEDEEDQVTNLLPMAEPMAEPGMLAQIKFRRKQKLLLALSVEVMGALVLVAGVLVTLLLAAKHDVHHNDHQWGHNQQEEMEPMVGSWQISGPTSLVDVLQLPNFTREALESPRSPQAKAYQWLIQHNMTLDRLPLWRLRQRFALATYYHSTRGDHWVKNRGWLDWDIHECNWEQVAWNEEEGTEENCGKSSVCHRHLPTTWKEQYHQRYPFWEKACKRWSSSTISN